MSNIKQRLEYLRGEIYSGRISYEEKFELEAIAKYMEPGDVELLQWAGICEHANTHEKLDGLQCEDCGYEVEVEED